MLNNIAKNTFRQLIGPLKPSITAIRFPFAHSTHENEQAGKKYTLTKEQERIIMDQQIPKGPTAEDVIKKDASLNAFMIKIYKTTGLSISASLGISYMLANSLLVYSHPFALLFGGMGASFAGIIAFNMIAPIIKREKIPGGQLIEKWENPFSRQMAFASIIAGSGAMLSPFLSSILAMNPGLIPMAIGLSVLVMGGSSLYALRKPLGEFKTWESTLTGGIVGLIGMNILSIIASMMIGPNVFSYACSKVDLYVGLGLFTAFQAYDTQKAVEDFRRGYYDHLTHVIQFFLNFKNLFIRILQILSRNRN
jgi:FtsH-binding integral membrane protein